MTASAATLIPPLYEKVDSCPSCEIFHQMTELPDDTFGALYAFGRRNLTAALREHWWYYLGLCIVGSILTAESSTGTNFQTSGMEVFAAFPAVAAATRLFDPSFRMRIGQLGGLLAIWLIPIAGACLIVGVIIALILKVSSAFAFLLLLAFPTLIWLVIKFTLAMPFYALNNARTTVLGALGHSWNSVTAERWWRIFGLELAIGLTLLLPGGIAGALITLALKSSGTTLFTAVLVGALVYTGAAIALTVWAEISLVGIASRTLQPGYLPHE
jgi:hypothetical protein